MLNKGWLKEVLAEAREKVHSRPEWQRNRVIETEHHETSVVNEPPQTDKSSDQLIVARIEE